MGGGGGGEGSEFCFGACGGQPSAVARHAGPTCPRQSPQFVHQTQDTNCCSHPSPLVGAALVSSANSSASVRPGIVAPRLCGVVAGQPAPGSSVRDGRNRAGLRGDARASRSRGSRKLRRVCVLPSFLLPLSHSLRPPLFHDQTATQQRVKTQTTHTSLPPRHRRPHKHFDPGRRPDSDSRPLDAAPPHLDPPRQPRHRHIHAARAS